MTSGHVRPAPWRFVAVAVLALGLGACSGDRLPSGDPGPSVTPEPTQAPVPRATEPPAPEDRACYDLTYDGALSPTSEKAPLACDRPHTAMTYAVGRLDNVVGGHLVAVDSQRVQASVAATCPARFAPFVGGSPEALALSMLRSVWFTPTVAQSDAGAEWYRCDVIAVAGDERLAPLTGRLAGVLTTAEGRARYAMCGTTAPDAEAFERVLCSAPHAWRAIDVADFAPGTYPGEDAARARGQGPCEDAGREVAQDPLAFEWGYEWPTAKQWQAGQTFGRCWAPD